VFKIVAKVSDEFEKNFLAQEMMDVLRLVYLQFWFKFSCEETFYPYGSIENVFIINLKNLDQTKHGSLQLLM